jgi:hypothetical protein
LSDEPTIDRTNDGGMPDSLVGSGAEFERSEGIHLLPQVSAAPNELPPSAAIAVQPTPEASTPAAPPAPASPDSGD